MVFSLLLPSEGHLGWRACPSPVRVEVVLPASLPHPGLNFRFRSALSSPSLCLLLPSPSLRLTPLPPLSPSGILQHLHSFSPPPLSLSCSACSFCYPALCVHVCVCPHLGLALPHLLLAPCPCLLVVLCPGDLVPESGSLSSTVLPFLLLWAMLTLLGLQKRIMVWAGQGCGPFSPIDSRTRRAFTPSWGCHGLGETSTCLGGGGGLW